ncbi:Mediator of RNA polymerase II transcription subunit 6 [Emydomyces testavorans]|uniref:Mediator of RNA polymerase II transcription subunit 6 n=1 Tax=Emydomyces testavorans TaxID=2070801 RepID=A0AAF0DNR4_9EURO|nr:Mediator of RNA polymerase II transcription subunit 6 [Emydomyces testavorans]
MGGFIHSNNILFYFAESPFFDPTSNNASLALQAMHNENLRPFIETREAFEGRLKTMQGLEFMVVHDPLLEAAAANAAAVARGEQPKEPSNVWVIRKQMRRRSSGVGAQDDVQILATYFVVGDSVFMAPSVWSVVGRRVHTPKTLEPSQLGQQSTQQSKETTPMSDIQRTAGDKSTTKAPLTPTSTSGLSSSALQDALNFAETLNLLARYGDEYMDESPLVGEPGSFIFAKAAAPAQEHLSATGGVASAQTTKQNLRSAAGTPAPPGAGRSNTPAAGPANIQLDATKGKVERGPDKAATAVKDKGKRRKSKIGSIGQ